MKRSHIEERLVSPLPIKPQDRRQNHEPRRGTKSTKAEFSWPLSLCLLRLFAAISISSKCLTTSRPGRDPSRFDRDSSPVAVVAGGVVGQHLFVFNQHSPHDG